MKIFTVYEQIYFSFLFRDEEFPAVLKIKGFRLKSFLKSIYDKIKTNKLDNSISINNKLKDSIWLYVESINQYRAMSEIAGYCNSVLVTHNIMLIDKLISKDIYYLGLIHSKSKMNIFDYWKLFGKKFFTHLTTIIKNYDVYESLSNTLEVYNPIAVVMSNDHNVFCRALLFASKKLNIPTIYIQHASVTNRFPPLIFNLNLLEGQDALNKYNEAGPILGKVELVGMIKFDKYFNKINSNTKVMNIGVALNNGDDFNTYFSMATMLKNKFSTLEFNFRFHPSIDTSMLEIPKYALISNPEEENSFEFLSKIDLLIAGNSSIHLEAILMNVVSIFVKSNNKDFIDYYGFIKNGLVDVIEDRQLVQEIHKLMINKSDVRYRAKSYVDTIGGPWDGKSQELVITIIENYISNFS